MVPRDPIYKEVIDDHQIGFAKMLSAQKNNQGVYLLFDIDKLKDTISQALQNDKGFYLQSFGERDRLVNTLRSFVLGLEKHT